MFRLEKNKLSDKLTPLDKQVTRTDDPLPKGSTGLIWIIAGRKGSGKSSLLLNSLKTKQKDGGFKKVFHRIHLVSPTARNDKKFSKLVDELEEDGRYHEKLTDEVIRKIVEDTKQFNESEEEEDPRSLLILDDCMTDLPKATEKGSFNDLIILARHYKLSVFILCQRYIGVNRIARANADLISFFRTDNKKELKTLTDDVNVDGDKLEVLYEFSTKDSPNDFLHINLLSTPITFFKKFDRIIL
jgi:hypothetical protein